MNDKILWYRARSILLGLDHYTQSYKRAYQVAKQSNHPDAQWLCKLFEYYQVLQKGTRLADLENLPIDPRLASFIFIERNQYSYLRDIPYDFATAMYCSKSILPQHLVARLTNNEDPFALYLCGKIYFMQIWTAGPDIRHTITAIAKDYLRRAANLGHNDAILLFTKYTNTGVKAIKSIANVVIATQGQCISEFKSAVAEYVDESEPKRFVKLGKIYTKLVNSGTTVDDYSFLKRAQNVYQRNIIYTRDAVNTWLLCVNRLNQEGQRILLNRDIRRKIGLLIWKSRKEGFY